jgi:sugar lactone lactonase YvrE
MQEFVATPCTTDLFELGECCRWDDVREELYWLDVPTGRFFRAHADGPKVEITKSYLLPGWFTALAPMKDRASGWIVALNQSILRLDESGRSVQLASPEAHQNGEVRTNDGSADPWGRFWIGSMAFSGEAGRGSLYRFHESTGIDTVLTKVTISNGLAWSADRRSMYYVDSGPGTIYVFDADENGDVSNQRVFVQLDVDTEGTPDGLCIDKEGSLWVAVWGGYEVRRYSPAGEQLARVAISTAQPSCCAIGGANGTTLYITTAREDMSVEQLAREADAGRLFCVDVGVEGTPLLAYDPDVRSMSGAKILTDPPRIGEK